MDSVTLREEHTTDTPASDSYLRGARLLNVAPNTTAVFEDALSGVQANQSGNFDFLGAYQSHRPGGPGRGTAPT
ncbi:hypothetical protein MUBE_09130 [Mycobacterium uberis]|uniref:Uncharacterized protein n=1 Tax=Mycobacterium uberis TaxID=2162698 RepID=A0A3E1HGC5_9MYCO|nr:hypothetical protein MUBE_09130 [Mycobacterium uberis]